MLVWACVASGRSLSSLERFFFFFFVTFNLSVTMVLHLSCSCALVGAMEVMAGTWDFWKHLALGEDPGHVENGWWGVVVLQAEGRVWAKTGKPEAVG